MFDELKLPPQHGRIRAALFNLNAVYQECFDEQELVIIGTLANGRMESLEKEMGQDKLFRSD